MKRPPLSSSFIIFFENCRPFTKFRKILFGITIGVVLVVLYLGPEFFIISGTEMLRCVGGIKFMFPYIFGHVVNNAQFALYKTMTQEQWIFLLIYIVAAYPLYLANKKISGFLVDKLLFSEREYKDE